MLFGIWEIFNNKTILPPFPIISLFLLPTSKWCNSTAREKQLLEVWVYFMRFGEGDLFFLLNLKTSPQTQIWDWFWKRAGQPGPFCSQWFVAHIPEALPPPLPPACSKFSNGLLMSPEWSPRQPAALQHPAPGFSPAVGFPSSPITFPVFSGKGLHRSAALPGLLLSLISLQI